VVSSDVVVGKVVAPSKIYSRMCEELLVLLVNYINISAIICLLVSPVVLCVALSVVLSAVKDAVVSSDVLVGKVLAPSKLYSRIYDGLQKPGNVLMTF